MEGNGLFSLFVIFLAVAIAPLIASCIPRVRVPGVVVEIVLGMVIGPFVLGLVEPTLVLDTLSSFGLAFLFFLAGYEVNFEQIKGRPIARATAGWFLGLLLALSVAAAMVAAGVPGSPLYIGAALCTTALGALIPILRDQGELETPFGTLVLATGALGEFGPIVLMAVVLETARSGFTSALALNVFLLLVLGGVLLARKVRLPWLARIIRGTLHTTGQLAIRLAILLVVAFVFVADLMGLEFLLGAFAAGVIVAQMIRTLPDGDETVHVVEGKLEAVGYGFLIPIFFLMSGVKFNLGALLASPLALALLPAFLVLFFVIRGLPALFLFRRDLPPRGRIALGLFAATQLPLVIAISNLGVESGQMAVEVASSLVGAGMLSMLLYPVLALALRRSGGAASSPPNAVHTPGKPTAQRGATM